MPRNLRENALILIYVQTRDADGNPIQYTPQNIKDHVFFTDTSGDTANDTGPSVTEFETVVKKGGKVTWVGAVSNHVSNPQDYVIITGFPDDTNPSGLSNGQRLPNPGLGNYFQANVNRNASGEITYTIQFNVHTVVNGEDNYQSCQIDPKLRIDPGSKR